MGIQRHGPAGVVEEAVSHQDDVVGLLEGPLQRAMAVGGLAGGQGAVGAVELPGDMDGLLDEEAVDLVLGLEAVGPGVESGPEQGRVLAGEDGGPGPHPVLQGVELGIILACSRPGPG